MKPPGDVAWRAGDRGEWGTGGGRGDGKQSDTDTVKARLRNREPRAIAARGIRSLAPQISEFFFCYVHDRALSRSRSGTCVSRGFNFGAHARTHPVDEGSLRE